MPNDEAAVLQGTPALSGLDAGILRALLDAGERRQLAPGARLFATGDPFAGEVYVLLRGELEVRRAGGRVERPAPGYLVGLSSYLAESAYGSTAVAIGTVRVAAIPAAALRDLEQRHPPLFDALNTLIARGLRERTVTQPPAVGALARPVAGAMSSPLGTCPPELSVRAAHERMVARDLGCLVVVDAGDRLKGIVTHRTLVAALLHDGADPDAVTVAAASRPAQTIDVGAPLWLAEERQERERLKYLVVTRGSTPVGMLSQTDIVRALAAWEGHLAAGIRTAESLEALAERYAAMGAVAERALESNRRASRAVRVVSEAHLAVQRRCVELTLRELDAEATGPPPAAFAVLVMGSGGRKEMMLNPDQDNGLILADEVGAAGAPARAWFQRFAARLNLNLDRVGYVLCPGEIMARNPMFHMSVSEWKARIAALVRRPSEKAARWSNIVFDFDTLYGDDSLTRALREHLHRELGRHERLLQFMVADDAEGRPPLGWFNQLVTSGRREGKGTVDVKRNGLRIVADAARILGLRAGVTSANTGERLDALKRLGVLSDGFVATVTAAYDELLDIVLCHQLEQYRGGLAIDKLVAPADLTPPERESLRVAMRAVKRLQDRLQAEIGSQPYLPGVD